MQICGYVTGPNFRHCRSPLFWVDHVLFNSERTMDPIWRLVMQACQQAVMGEAEQEGYHGKVLQRGHTM